MNKNLLALNSSGQLVIKSPDGEIRNIARYTHKLACAYLVIDCSSSMHGNNIAQAQKGAIEFAAEAIKKGYSIGIIKFADYASAICELSSELSAISNKLSELIPGGSTNMAEGIILSIEKMYSIKGLRSIVIVTDGFPNNQSDALDAAKNAKETGIEIITIGTDDADKDFLAKLASNQSMSMKVSRELLSKSIASAVLMLPTA